MHLAQSIIIIQQNTSSALNIANTENLKQRLIPQDFHSMRALGTPLLKGIGCYGLPIFGAGSVIDFHHDSGMNFTCWAADANALIPV